MNLIKKLEQQTGLPDYVALKAYSVDDLIEELRQFASSGDFEDKLNNRFFRENVDDLIIYIYRKLVNKKWALNDKNIDKAKLEKSYNTLVSIDNKIEKYPYTT